MKSTGWWICFLDSSAWSSSQFVRRWRYQFTRLGRLAFVRVWSGVHVCVGEWVDGWRVGGKDGSHVGWIPWLRYCLT
jgi:hypothetical protein